MNTITSLENLLSKLATERDELRVRTNLASKEIRDEWEKAEAMFEKLQDKARNFAHNSKQASQEATEQSGEVWQATKLLADEVGELFRGIGSRL